MADTSFKKKREKSCNMFNELCKGILLRKFFGKATYTFI